MSEAPNDSTDDHALLAVTLGAEGGKHRGSASSAEEPDAPANGRHRRVEPHDD